MSLRTALTDVRRRFPDQCQWLEKSISIGLGTCHRFKNKCTSTIEHVVASIKADLESDRRQFRRRDSYEIRLAFALPALISGTIFVAVFAPLAIMSAQQASPDPIDILLLQKAPKSFSGAVYSGVFPNLSVIEARPIVLAAALLYGTTSVVAGLVFLGGDLPKLAVTANGIYFGYCLTYLATVHLFEIVPNDAFTGRLFNLKLAYVMIVSYFCDAAKTLLTPSRTDFGSLKYSQLFSGLRGLAGGWILARGFGADATFYTGGVFLVASFISLALSECVFGSMFSLIRKRIIKGSWSYYNEPGIRSWKLFRLSLRRYWYTHRWHTVTASALCVFFPILASAIYVLVLERF
jgi:hypothetical protein